MMRGRNILALKSNELMSNVDIFPTLLKLRGINYNNQIDGTLLKDFGGNERKFTITKSIFPGQTYKLAINDKEHLFKFKTKANTRDDGLISIEEYTIELKEWIYFGD